jgi:glutamyl-tRNA synthetase
MPVRFAPSPTGNFHIGNLRTAWISHWWARTLKLPWVVRFEDIDRPRIAYGAKESQLNDFKILGLVPDQITIQSQNLDRHWELFLKAVKDSQVYPCFCSRKEIALASAPHGGAQISYTGKCRSLEKWPALVERPTMTWRFKMTDMHNDFVIARTKSAPNHLNKEGFVPAYQWACAIDDIDGKYDLLVRASDLKDSAEQQRSVQKWVAPTVALPAIFHTSLVMNDDFTRLEKRNVRATLEEVVRAGHDVNSILERFDKSFEKRPEEYSNSKLFGEIKEQITMTELGLV